MSYDSIRKGFEDEEVEDGSREEMNKEDKVEDKDSKTD